MKKRALLYFPFDIDSLSNRSVFLKSNSLIDGFINQGYTVDKVFHSNNNLIINEKVETSSTLKALLKIPGFKQLMGYYLPFFLASISQKKYDVIFIRHKIATPISLFLLRRLRRNNPKAKIILEYPTYPFADEFKGLVKIYIKLFDTWFRKKNQKYADSCAVYDLSDKIRGLKAIPIVNGYNSDLESLNLNYSLPDFDKKLIITGISSELQHYHGYDRLLEGISEYYKSGGEYDITFQIIGRGKEIERLLSASEKLNLHGHVKNLGFMTSEQINDVLQNTHIALGSIGLHRINLFEQSPLKSAFYTFVGVPFIYSGNDKRFDEGFEYKFQIDTTDKPVDIQQIITEYNRLRNKNYKQEMSDFAKSNLSWSSQVKKLLEYS